MRTWTWTENEAEYDPETGAFVRLHMYVFAGAPRFPGDPTDLTQLTAIEEFGSGGTLSGFAMNGIPYADQAALISGFNETQIERLQLEAEPAA
jgi:hypothetical protein